mgnify:CR=1 FL=1
MYLGMNRVGLSENGVRVGVPHVRGDEPYSISFDIAVMGRSPCTWG